MSGEASETVLNRINKLNGLNYSTWSYQIKLVLMDFDLWTTVEPGEERPTEDAEKIRKFQSRQGKALAKICLSVGEEQQQHIRHLESPREVWQELEKLYAPKDSKFRIVQLRRQLYAEKLSNHRNIESYLGRINATVTELTKSGDKIDDKDLAMIILCGLSQDWDNLASVICNLPEDEFTCSNVKRRLLAEAERRNQSAPNTSTGTGALVAVKSTDGKREKSYPERDKKIQEQSKLSCQRCGRRGHLAKFCRTSKHKIKPQQYQEKPVDKTRTEKNLAMTCHLTIDGDALNTWVVDSGATHHMTPNKDYFHDIKENDEQTLVTTADGTTTPTSGKGTVYAKLLNNRGKLTDFIANNAIYVPGIKHGVLSVLQMMENERKVVFDRDGCRIYNNEGQVLVQAEKQGRLFVVRTTPMGKTDEASYQAFETNDSMKENQSAVNSLALDLWHKRLMHVNKERIIDLSKKQAVRGLKIINEKPTKCDDCLKGKSTRLPFQKAKASDDYQREKMPLNLVHCDIMGPMDVESWGRAKYAFVIVDDATRYVFAYSLRNKSDTLEKFKIWLKEAETQTGKKLKRVRTDNGLEFCNEEWDKFCKDRGIIHERTMTYTPEQNPIAERMNRTLLDLVRSTISASGLPKGCWAELIHTAAYLRNRTTNKNDQEKTPHELWFGRKPCVGHLRACGCKTFVHIPRQTRHSKLSPRAQEGLLVGYALRGRGWRIWIPTTKTVIESRNCVFREEVFSDSNPEDLPSVAIDSCETPTTSTQNANEPSCSKLTSSNKPSDSGSNCEKLPATFEDAIRAPDCDRWIEAMQQEMESFAKHDVWELTELPQGITPVKCRWVLQKKRNEKGEVTRYRARLVAKGFTQQPGIDYEETYSPVAGFETIRMLTAVAAEKGWTLDQFDVKSAYLHGDLYENVYMEQPKGFSKPGSEHLFCKLKKAIYGLKQSGRCWNEHFDERLQKAGFERSKTDPCVYRLTTNVGSVLLSVYVDDILTVSENEEIRGKTKKLLADLFDINYLGRATYLLGVHFTYSNGKITLSQENYIDKVLERFDMQDAKGIKTPMEARLILPTRNSNENESEIERLPYRELIGSLMYISQRTRPDIAYAVTRLAQNCANYMHQHWLAAKRVLKYLKATKSIGLTYTQTKKPIMAFSDADWATDPETRRSTTGYVIIMGGGPVVWKSVKQTTIALSTMEAEYIAMSECVRELTWIRSLLREIGQTDFLLGATEIKCDSRSAISHAYSYIDQSRTKHIHIKFHFIREAIKEKQVEVNFVPSEDNTADILTKALGRTLHEKHCKQLLSIPTPNRNKSPF